MKIRTDRDPALPPNTADPSPLLLGEAALHLIPRWWFDTESGSRQPLAAWMPWATLVSLAMVVLAILLGIGNLTALLAGAVAAYVLVLGAYLCWYGRFCHLNSRRGTLCPACTSRMWQLCCSRCEEPVPPLALWLWGLFMPRCPHCDQHLSARHGTLKAWCSTCDNSYERPDRWYGKPTHVIVWIANSLPVSPESGWFRMPDDRERRMKLFHHGDRHSLSLMFICAGYQEGGLPIDEHLIVRTRLLLISRDVHQRWVESIQGLFSPHTLKDRVPPIGHLERGRDR